MAIGFYRPTTPAPKVVAAIPQMTTKPKMVNGQVVGYYHIYPMSLAYPHGRTVFVPNKAPGAAPGAAPGGAAAGAAAGGGADTTPDINQDPNYQARVAGIFKNRDTALGGLNIDEASTRKAYGIDDLSDPFSKARLLQESYDRNKASTNTSMAGQGFLYAGSLQNAQNLNAENYTKQNDALHKAYDAALAAIKQRRAEINSAADTDVVTAGSDTLSRLLSTRPDADLAGASVNTTLPPAGPAEAAATPKAGYSYVTKTGARKGQSYNIVKQNGKTYHRYANGTMVRVSG